MNNFLNFKDSFNFNKIYNLKEFWLIKNIEDVKENGFRMID